MRPTKFLLTVFTAALLGGAASNIASAQHGVPPAQQSAPPTIPGQNTPGGINNVPDQSTPVKTDDKKFVMDAALGGMTEVELGKLAAQKAASDSVKEFAQKMVDDHSKADDQLRQVANEENIPVPASLDPKHQSRIDRLSKLSGESFDKAYVKDQLKDHEMDVKEFNAEAQYGTDSKVKAFASSTLPTLEQHLDMVKNIAKQSRKGGL